MITSTVVKLPIPVGAIKQIGENGPAYEVLEGMAKEKQFIRIRLIETGEELDYPRAQSLSDRDAA